MGAAGTALTARVGGTDAAIVADERSAPVGWDERAVRAPGGHVMQSTTWADYRAAQGVEPRFLTFADGHVVLASMQRSPGLPGLDVIVRRGPSPAGDAVPLAVDHARALAAWSREQGGRTLFLDPERDFDPMWESAMDASGFEVVAGVDPSIHVMRLDLAGVADEAALLAQCSKATRQRIRSAEREGIAVRDDVDGARLDEFLVLMRQRAEVLGIPLQRRGEYVHGWRSLLAAGLARLLLAEHEGHLVGGLFLFRHGGIHATAYSADDAATRAALPGTMHLVRWTAIRDAYQEGAAAIELGGVDLPGHRQPPAPGEPTRGLYEHKRGFGAVWVERAPPRRIVLRPGLHRLAVGRKRVADALRGLAR